VEGEIIGDHLCRWRPWQMPKRWENLSYDSVQVRRRKAHYKNRERRKIVFLKT
jgi:hypothetical protein